MLSDNDKFLKPILYVNKQIIKCLIGILTVCLILAAVNLLIKIVTRLIGPPLMDFELMALFDVFNLILIMVIGYELIKSMAIIISSETIPSLPILQIAVIAVANKIITLDIRHTDFATLLGLAGLMAALGVTYYLHSAKKPAPVDPITQHES